MSNTELKHSEVSVRGITFNLMTYTRSLELCARMNYETENLTFIDGIPNGDILYDLGACEGRFSIYAAKRGVNVFSFEPEQKNFSVLKQNVQLNGLQKNIAIFNLGIGAMNQNAMMQIGQPWEGGHQKVVNHGNRRNDLAFDFVEDQQIKLISLDSFIQSHPKPNYLKIDIDGSEIPFLKGAEQTLRTRELQGIIFELNIADDFYAEIADKLISYGFAEISRFAVPNEPNLFNITYQRILLST